MNNKEKASISILKIMAISIIFILISGIAVMASNTELKDIKIVLQNGYELTALTSKTTVKEVLKENNIDIQENQKTIPELDETVESGTIIKIVDKTYNEIQIANVSKNGAETTLNELLNNYSAITEKIVTEQEDIPYETITKNTAGTDTNVQNKVLQEGQNGIKEVTYKVKYQNEVEIEKTQLSEKIIKEPVNKIVQVKKVVTSRAGTLSRTTLPSTTASTTNGIVYKITAYCPCAICTGKATGRTAMGTKATAGRTIAASAKFAFGTKLNINGHTYTVEDRGGGVNGNHIDIFVNTHAEALAWGVRYLPVSVEQ